jgi:hypothetical protein
MMNLDKRLLLMMMTMMTKKSSLCLMNRQTEMDNRGTMMIQVL